MSKFIVVVAIALTLLACQTPAPEQLEIQQQSWLEHQAGLAAMQSWDLRARAAVVRPGEAYNISLSWKRSVGQFMILLEAPFGQGVFRIEGGQQDEYRLRLPDGREFQDSTPEALFEQVLGWSLPISGMEYWIRGIPHPGSEARHRLGADALARSIRQDGWEIAYTDYYTESPDAGLPRRLKLAREDLSIKLAIERWRRADGQPGDSDLFPDFN